MIGHVVHSTTEKMKPVYPTVQRYNQQHLGLVGTTLGSLDSHVVNRDGKRHGVLHGGREWLRVANRNDSGARSTILHYTDWNYELRS